MISNAILLNQGRVFLPLDFLSYLHFVSRKDFVFLLPYSLLKILGKVRTNSYKVTKGKYCTHPLLAQVQLLMATWPLRPKNPTPSTDDSRVTGSLPLTSEVSPKYITVPMWGHHFDTVVTHEVSALPVIGWQVKPHLGQPRSTSSLCPARGCQFVTVVILLRI